MVDQRRRRAAVPARALDAARRVLAPLRAVAGTFTGIGRAVVLVCGVSWVLAWQLGWVEMAVIATVCLLLLGVGALFMVGTTRLDVRTTVEPPRVTVGEPLAGELGVRNLARTPLWSVFLEFPIGRTGIGFDLPMLMPGSQHTELFVIPTERRGVIPIGPAVTARGDALGLFRREKTWTERTEVFVHPRVVPLEPFGAGLVRDLEGVAAQHVSMSDLAFHALREYAPGDDLRHIHWRSTARHGKLLVRQFLDTRRSHLTAVVDSDPASYVTEEEYEAAISVAASLVVRGIFDGYDVSLLSGSQVMTRATGRPALDVCSRAEPERIDLTGVCARAARIASDTSVAFVISGPLAEYGHFQRSASQFPVDVGRLAIRVEAGARASLRTAADLPLLTLGGLDDLGRALQWGLT